MIIMIPEINKNPLAIKIIVIIDDNNPTTVILLGVNFNLINKGMIEIFRILFIPDFRFVLIF